LPDVKLLSRKASKNTMPNTLQQVMIGEELRTAVSLLKYGLRELNRVDGANDFYHVPLLLLASGFERLMKTVICCYHLKKDGEFPTRNIFRGQKGHDLVRLLDVITKECFSDTYVADIPAAREDINFLRDDIKLRNIVRILSDFGKSARYYNLNVVLGEADPGPSPDEEWGKLEMEILQEDPEWAARIADPSQESAIFQQINCTLTKHCERMARSLSRLFTIGQLGDLAKQISPNAYHFLFLTDDALGITNYESVRI
jgi:hypothetical protein